MTKNKHIDIVKRRLWASGFRVSERSFETEGFDLLVEGKYKVRVMPKGTRGEFGCDVVAVPSYAFSKAVIGYYTDGWDHYTTSPREAFGLPSAIKDKNHGKKTSKEVTPEGSGEEASA